MRTLAPWGGFERFADPVWEPFEMPAGDWAPRLNVSETKDAMVVTAEMPGVDSKEIGVVLTGDLLTLKGHRGVQERRAGRDAAEDASLEGDDGPPEGRVGASVPGRRFRLPGGIRRDRDACP
jgi:HSP20 family molecular chaperone IbpA